MIEISYAVLLIMPIFVTLYMIYLIYQIIKKDSFHYAWDILKFGFCMLVTVSLLMSCIFVMSINTYTLSKAFLESKEYINPIIKEISFSILYFGFQVIFMIAIWVTWKKIYFQQIIKGNGPVKERLKSNWIGIKQNINNYKRKRKDDISVGNQESKR